MVPIFSINIIQLSYCQIRKNMSPKNAEFFVINYILGLLLSKLKSFNSGSMRQGDHFSPSNHAIQFLKAAIDFFSSNHNAYLFKVDYINYRFLRLFFGLREMVSLSHGTTVKTI